MGVDTDICQHLMTLYFITVEFNLKRTLELGTRYGESTLALLEACKTTGGHLWSIDDDPCEEAKSRVQHYGLWDYWTFIQGDNRQVEWNQEIDHLFIDTSNKYDQKMEELKKYYPHLRVGGWFTMHDPITEPETYRAWKDFGAKTKEYLYLHNNGLLVAKKLG